MPVVILLHGGGGLYDGNTIYDWASKLRSIGIATFVVNSNARSGCPKCYSQNEGLPNMIDAFQAMALLSTHPRIDPDRIGLMGFSVGGIATLYATVKRFQRMWAPEGLELAAYVSFYPGCNYTFNEEEQVTDRPVRILMGDKDQLGWSVPCENYVNRLRKAGKDFEITIFPGAHHAFDRPEASRKPYSTGPHPTYCLWQEEKDIGLIQVTEASEAFYAGCLSILPERARECRQSSTSSEMNEALVTMLELYETDKKTKAQNETDDSGSAQSVDVSQSDPALDKEFAEFVSRYVSKFWQGWGPGKKIGECLGENAASMTTGAKKGVIKYGLEEAFEKLSDEDVASFDKLFGLCEKGGVKKKNLIQSDPALDKEFGEFVMAYVSEQWGGLGAG
jgi:dienelactone hydrolase